MKLFKGFMFLRKIQCSVLFYKWYSNIKHFQLIDGFHRKLLSPEFQLFTAFIINTVYKLSCELKNRFELPTIRNRFEIRNKVKNIPAIYISCRPHNKHTLWIRKCIKYGQDIFLRGGGVFVFDILWANFYVLVCVNW